MTRTRPRARERAGLAAPEATLSIRFIWPFARLLSSDPRYLGLLERLGIPLSDFGNPETRVPHRAVVRAMEETITALGDETIGLRAAAFVDPGDFDVLEYASRSASTFRDAIALFQRYFQILHEAAEISLVVEGERAVWRFRVTDGVPQPPGVSDFIVASAIGFANRNVSVADRAIEVHLTHLRPSYADEYEKTLAAPARFSMPANAVVLRRERLDVPMLRANAELATAYELQARRVLQGMRSRKDLPGRVRAEIIGLFPAGTVTMPVAARRVGMSATTLRRKLEEEGTTFSQIVDELRQEMAESHLASASANVSEVAFLLGFSDVRAFGRAFRRWTGVSPTEYRAQRGRSVLQ